MVVRELDTTTKATPDLLKKEIPRRAFLLKFGFLLNGIAAVFVGVPVLGYLFSSFRTSGSFNSWVTLGPVASFPENQTRLAKYQNPHPQPWDGKTTDIPCWVRRMEGDKFQIFA